MGRLIKPSIVNCDFEEKYKWIFWEHKLFQAPWMIAKLVVGLIYNIIIYLFILKEPTDDDIVNYLENTTMALLVNSGSNRSTFEVDDCQLKSCLSSVTVRSIKIVFKKDARGRATIEAFHFNGEKITNKCLMMETIFFYHTASAHPKFHLYSNSLTKYIVDNNISALLPSTKTSLPLHNALTRSPTSPVTDMRTRTEKPWIHRFITRVYSVEITRESLIEETLKPSCTFKDLSQGIVKGSLPFVTYLTECRMAVEKSLSHTGLPNELLDPLFYHIIVHAVDHASCYAQTWGLKFGVGEVLAEPSRVSLFRSLMFRWQMTKPSSPPIWSNKIKYIKKNPFYAEIYEEVKRLDAKYEVNFADFITASIMY